MASELVPEDEVLLTLKVSVADLASTRFAISPVSETILAVRLLGRSNPFAVNLPWIQRAREELDHRPLRIPRLWPLIVHGRSTWPEFLAPAPRVKSPDLADELSRLRQTPQDWVDASLRRVFGRGPWPESATELLERPAQSLAEIAAEVAECHDRLIAPYWERIRSVLDADIAFRAAGPLASGGAGKLLNDLHPELHWSADTLTLAGPSATDGRPDRKVVLGPAGLVLVPSVFVWPGVAVKLTTATQTTVRYPARGAATVWHTDPHEDPTIEALLGPQRAWLLRALRSPASPTSLASELGVTPSAVSQHLKVLYLSGLAERQRSGRRVLYVVSRLGLILLSEAEARQGRHRT